MVVYWNWSKTVEGNLGYKENFFYPGLGKWFAALETQAKFVFKSVYKYFTRFQRRGTFDQECAKMEPEVFKYCIYCWKHNYSLQSALKTLHYNVKKGMKVNVIFYNDEIERFMVRQQEYCTRVYEVRHYHFLLLLLLSESFIFAMHITHRSFYFLFTSRIFQLANSGIYKTEMEVRLVLIYEYAKKAADNNAANKNKTVVDNGPVDAWEAKMSERKRGSIDARQPLKLEEGETLSAEYIDVDEHEEWWRKQQEREDYEEELLKHNDYVRRDTAPWSLVMIFHTLLRLAVICSVDYYIGGFKHVPSKAAAGVHQVATSVSTSFGTFAQEFESMVFGAAVETNECFQPSTPTPTPCPLDEIPTSAAFKLDEAKKRLNKYASRAIYYTHDYIAAIHDPVDWNFHLKMRKYHHVSEECANGADLADLGDYLRAIACEARKVYGEIESAAVRSSASTPLSGITVSEFVSSIMDGCDEDDHLRVLRRGRWEPPAICSSASASPIRIAISGFFSSIVDLPRTIQTKAENVVAGATEVYQELKSKAVLLPARVTPSRTAISNFVSSIVDPFKMLARTLRSRAQAAVALAMKVYHELKSKVVLLLASVTPSRIATPDFSFIAERAAAIFQKVQELRNLQATPTSNSTSLPAFNTFDTIALVERFMTPSQFDEDRGVAFFGLLEQLIPVEEDEELHCCHRDDLLCRVNAIVTDYAPELATYLQLQENADSHAEPFDALDFVLQHDKTLFRPSEIPEPTVHPSVQLRLLSQQYAAAFRDAVASSLQQVAHWIFTDEPTPSPPDTHSRISQDVNEIPACKSARVCVSDDSLRDVAHEVNARINTAFQARIANSPSLRLIFAAVVGPMKDHQPRSHLHY